MATIYEVAARAGVSPATVSRVFNGASVSAERSRLVRQAAGELGYTPSRAARSLRTQTSSVIALVVTDIENPFFTALARGVEDTAGAAGYSVVLCNSDEDPAREARYLDIAIAEHMAGVILVPSSEGGSDVSGLVARGRPVVTADRGLPGSPVDSVVADNAAGGRQATDALHDQGFRRVGCVTGPPGAETAQLRAAGWREAFARRSPELPVERYLRHADYRVGGGRAAAAELLDLPEPPDALFVANNLMAVGALLELAARGLEPSAFGLAAFGDLPYFPLGPRGVTVVPLPARLIGATAAQVLLDRIGGQAHPHRTVLLRDDPRVPTS